MPKPEYGRIKSGDGPSINYAAKLAVCDELRKRGVAARPGRMNDGRILLESANAPTIRVKAKTSAALGWRWNAKEGVVFQEISHSDFCVLVELSDKGSPAGYFIVPTKEVDRKLREAFKKWLDDKPGRSESNPVWFLGDHQYQRDWLQGYRDWGLLA